MIDRVGNWLFATERLKQGRTNSFAPIRIMRQPLLLWESWPKYSVFRLVR